MIAAYLFALFCVGGICALIFWIVRDTEMRGGNHQ